MKINHINYVAILFSISIIIGCKNSQKPTMAKGEKEIVLHCSGPEYMSNKKMFRANATGESSDLEIARKKATSNAKAALASQIETTIKVLLTIMSILESSITLRKLKKDSRPLIEKW